MMLSYATKIGLNCSWRVPVIRIWTQLRIIFIHIRIKWRYDSFYKQSITLELAMGCEVILRIILKSVTIILVWYALSFLLVSTQTHEANFPEKYVYESWLWQSWLKIRCESPSQLISKNTISRSQDGEVLLLPAKENKLARKWHLSVSKFIILYIIRLLNSENRNPNFHLLHTIRLVTVTSPALSQKQLQTLDKSKCQALQAQMAPSGQVVKTIRVYLLLKFKRIV